MTQNGTVISESGNTAVVRVIRKSACEGCKQRKLCAGTSGGCSEEKPLDVTAKNTIGAKTGDCVELCSDSTFILGIAFCIFILPIIFAITAYFVSSLVTDSSVLQYTFTGIAFAFTLGAFLFGFNRKIKNNSYVEITKIIKKDKDPDQ